MPATPIEKLTIALLTNLSRKLGVDELDLDLVDQAVIDDDMWALDWKYPGIFHGSEIELPPHAKFVADTLDMWDFIELSHERLSPEDQERVKTGADPFGNNPRFSGFDGNNESEYLSAARTMVKGLDRWDRFAERHSLNSHSPVVDSYRRMLDVFLSMRHILADRLLNADELIAVLDARRHTENRK